MRYRVIQEYDRRDPIRFVRRPCRLGSGLLCVAVTS